MPVQEEVLDTIRRMSVPDLLDLVRALAIELEPSEGHGVTNAGSTMEPVEDGLRDAVAVSLREFDADRIEIIRAVREITDLGLREAQALAGASPAQVAAWSHDGGTDADADGPEGAGAPAKPRTPLPTGEGSEKMPIPRRPCQPA